MPLEGHWQTQNTPLRKLDSRERNIVVAVTIGTALIVLALLFVPGQNDKPLLDERGGDRVGCVETAVAGRVGSEPVVGCGAEARAICRRASGYEGPRAETIVDACLEAGVRF
jgi:hypothetical protein